MSKSRVHTKKLTVSQLVKTFPLFLWNPEDSSPCWQKHSLYPTLHQITASLHTLFLKLHTNNILPSTTTPPQYSLPFRFSYNNSILAVISCSGSEYYKCGNRSVPAVHDSRTRRQMTRGSPRGHVCVQGLQDERAILTLSFSSTWRLAKYQTGRKYEATVNCRIIRLGGWKRTKKRRTAVRTSCLKWTLPLASHLDLREEDGASLPASSEQYTLPHAETPEGRHAQTHLYRQGPDTIN